MHYFGKLVFLLCCWSCLLYACSKRVPTTEILYKRLGGERTLVAVSLQVSRKTEILEKFSTEEKRIFRQRFTEWLCYASSGPCKFPTHKEFFDEMKINPVQMEKLLQSLRQVLEEIEIPETERDELFLLLSHPSI